VCGFKGSWVLQVIFKKSVASDVSKKDDSYLTEEAIVKKEKSKKMLLQLIALLIDLVYIEIEFNN